VMPFSSVTSIATRRSSESIGPPARSSGARRCSPCPTRASRRSPVSSRLPPLAVDGDDAIVFALRGLVVKLDAATGVEPVTPADRRRPVRDFSQRPRRGPGRRRGGRAGVILPEPGEPEHDFLVASLDGATGAERWRLVRNGTPGPPDPDDADWDDTSDEATALALAPGGDVIACGYLRNVETAPTGRWCGSPATPASSGGATWSTEPRTDRTWPKRSPSMHLATCWSPARCRPRPRAGKSWSRGSTVPAASKGGAASPPVRHRGRVGRRHRGARGRDGRRGGSDSERRHWTRLHAGDAHQRR